MTTSAAAEITDARQALADDVSFSRALDRHWQTVARAAPHPALEIGREAQAALAELYERDVEDQRRAAQTLAEAFAQKSRQLEALLECLPAMTFVKDELLEYLFVDESYAAFLGRPSRQIVSKTDRNLFPPAVASRMEELDRQALDQATIIESVDVIETPAGASRVRAVRAPVCSSQGCCTSLLGVLFKEDDPLPQAGRAGREVAQVAHELRTPLSAAKEAIAVVQDGAAGPLGGRQREFVEIAARNCARLQRLLECALDLERIRGGAPALSLEEREAADIVETACELARRWVPSLSLTLTLEAHVRDACVDADLATRLIAELLVIVSRRSTARALRVVRATRRSRARDPGGLRRSARRSLRRP